MPKPPMLKPRQVIQILLALGFVQVRQKGSHRQFRHPDGRATTVSDHGEDIRPKMLHTIAKDIGLTWQDFIKKR